MIDQQMDAAVPGRLDPLSRPARPVDMEQAVAAIVAITRREWMSPRSVKADGDDATVNRPRSAHPLTRFSLDAERHIAWRARIGREAWVRNVVQFAKLKRTPQGAS